MDIGSIFTAIEETIAHKPTIMHWCLQWELHLTNLRTNEPVSEMRREKTAKQFV